MNRDHRGFANHELLYVSVWFAIILALGMPILASVRDGNISPTVGALLSVGLIFLFFLPWLWVWWIDRRDMKHDHHPKENREKSGEGR